MKFEEVSGLSELNFRPRRAVGYIYFLTYRGELVYVGKSVDVEVRIKQHKMPYDSVKYLEVAPEDMARIETEYIMALKPIFNSMGLKADAPQFLFSKQGFMLCKDCRMSVYDYGNNKIHLDGKLVGAYNSKKVVLLKSKERGFEFDVNSRRYTDMHLNRPHYFDVDVENVCLKKVNPLDLKYKMYTAVGAKELVPDDHIMKVGKYKGREAVEVYVIDPDYLDWYATTVLRVHETTAPLNRYTVNPLIKYEIQEWYASKAK